MATPPAAVQKCAAMLAEARGDTEKFAALFMVTKLVKAPACDVASRRALLDAVGAKFLVKLLECQQPGEDCPPSVYRSVALNVLGAFCKDPDLASHPNCLATIPALLRLVATSDEDDSDENLMVVNEAYSCLKALAAAPKARESLLAAGAVSALSDVYSKHSFQTDEALGVLALLTVDGQSAWTANPSGFHSLVNKITLDFETDRSERKFEIATVLHSLLSGCDKNYVSATASEEAWPFSLYGGLKEVLSGKIGKSQRDPALKLAALAVDLLGIEWTLTYEEGNHKFFLLLVQLCAIEIRMQLDDKSFKQALIEADLVASCFVVLEMAVAYMATDQLDLEQKEKQTVYTGLKGAFNAIASVLTKISNDKGRDSIAGAEKTYVCAMVRALGAWLAQETTAMRPQIYTLLPYMLSLANNTFYEHRTARLMEKKAEPGAEQSIDIPADVLRTMLPCLCHFAVEDKARDVILSTKQDEVLYECMAFHWDIVHYKRPPVPKSERNKPKTHPEPEMSPLLVERMKDSRAAMISLCNIFMNLTVLEAKHVEESVLFNTLMKFIFNNLPELKGTPENLVLHGHLAILGLLLLKQQSNKVKKNDFSICRYIQATIRFLWDAYIIDESNDPTALVISMSYKEHWSEIMELWFLGMQTMSSVLKLVPWISEFAIESGWAEGILDTLRKVKIGGLQPNIKFAFEDFLCHLVDASPDVVKVLKKADALRVCRNHRFMELGKKLFGD